MSVTREYVPRENAGGNFCGHDPLRPRLTLPVLSTDKQRPRVLRELQERIKQYFNDPSRLPSLNSANKSSRQQRSERREGCLLAISAITEFTDVASLRCGIPTAEGFKSLTLDYLAKFTGMGIRRMERAVADLKAANILTISQARQLCEDGSYRGLAAIKAVNALLFTAFGLEKWLKHERKRATVRLQKKAKKAGTTLTQWARNHLVIQGSIPNRATNQSWQPKHTHSVEFLKAKANLQLAIKHEHPGWSAAEVNAEAERLLQTRFRA